MIQTTSLTLETSTFPSTADHAGPMPPPLLSQTESRSQDKLPGLTSTLHLKSSSPAIQKMMVATVEPLSTPLLSSISQILLMRLAPCTPPEVTTMASSALPSTCARTATHINPALSLTSTSSTVWTNMAKSQERRR
jgi:hypothetical protein